MIPLHTYALFHRGRRFFHKHDTRFWSRFTEFTQLTEAFAVLLSTMSYININ